MEKIKEIYKLIAKNRNRFVVVASRYTEDKNVIDEVVQELYLYLYQCNKETLIDIYEKDGIEGIVKYGAVAIHRAITSSRSNYYYKYRKYYTKIVDCGVVDITQVPEFKDDLYKKKLIHKVEKELENMYWYDKKVFEVYYNEGHTLDSLAEKTGISRNSLFSTIKKVRTQLKEILDNEIFCK